MVGGSIETWQCVILSLSGGVLPQSFGSMDHTKTLSDFRSRYTIPFPCR